MTNYSFFISIILTGILTLLLFLATLVLVIISRYKIFEKAGQEGWKSLIPFYSSWVLVEISDVAWWFYLIIHSPIFISMSLVFPFTAFAGPASLVAYFFVNYNIAIKFDKEPIPFSLGLTIVPFIFYPIIAFSDSKYKNKKVSIYGPIKEN